jgi:hypothetical protein
VLHRRRRSHVGAYRYRLRRRVRAAGIGRACACLLPLACTCHRVYGCASQELDAQRSRLQTAAAVHVADLEVVPPDRPTCTMCSRRHPPPRCAVKPRA